MKINDILGNVTLARLHVGVLRDYELQKKVYTLAIPAQVQFVTELHRLLASEADEDKLALDELLHERTMQVLTYRFIWTLTADGKQLRCWWTFPSSFSPSHVDSCGMGDLWQVTGDPVGVSDFIHQYFHESVLDSPVRLPNGVTIFGFRWFGP